MESKNSPDLQVAAHLAKPFLLPGQTGQPLSLRCLPDGGMVVIAVDGRKLWFTAREVGRARKELSMPQVRASADESIPRLHEIDPRKKHLNARPIGKTRDGMSEMLALPENLKHLEKPIHDQSHKPQKPNPPAA
jgi:hypothetical protein